MKAYVPALITACLLVAFQGCVTEGTPISFLGTPHFVPQSQPDSVIETGIGQDPNTGGIWLQWYRARGVAGYKVYRADTTNQNGTPIQFTLIGNVIASTAFNDTSTVDVSSIQTGIRYYYYLLAYALDGSSSSPSDTINYELLTRPFLNYPSPNMVVNSGAPLFNWADRTGGGYTVIRIKDISVIPPEYVWTTRRFQIYGGSSSQVYFDFDSTAMQPLISGHSYQWRVDRFDVDRTGRPYEGARSVWWAFTVK